MLTPDEIAAKAKRKYRSLFIGSHEAILRPLLEAVLPPTAVRTEADNFYDRFYLRPPTGCSSSKTK